jgi:hypothetical protein
MTLHLHDLTNKIKQRNLQTNEILQRDGFIGLECGVADTEEEKSYESLFCFKTIRARIVSDYSGADFIY